MGSWGSARGQPSGVCQAATSPALAAMSSPVFLAWSSLSGAWRHHLWNQSGQCVGEWTGRQRGQHGRGWEGFLMGEAQAQGHLASPCFGLPCSRVGRTYRGVFPGRRTPDSWSQPPPRKRFPGGRGTRRVGPALHPQESGSGGLGHSLAACLVNNDIVMNI